MSDTVYHHLAHGIHPGAYVSPSPPDTTDLQDHVLWINTASGPPYQMFVWIQALAAWDAVGTVTGLPLGRLGEVLVHDGRGWTGLAPTQQSHTLTVVPKGTNLTVEWEPCCAGEVNRPAGPVLAASANVRCGAAVAMATTLVQLYASTRSAADAAYTGGIVNTLANLVNILLSVVTDGFPTLIVTASKPAIVAIATNILAANNISMYPPLTLTQQDIVRRAAYCALPAGVASFHVDPAVIDQWTVNLHREAPSFGYNQLPLLVQLLGVAPAEAWNTIAYVGAQTPSSACRTYTCISGRALGGGAVLSARGHALRGGALYGTTRGPSMRGGAVLAGKAPALQGGAVLG